MAQHMSLHSVVSTGRERPQESPRLRARTPRMGIFWSFPCQASRKERGAHCNRGCSEGWGQGKRLPTLGMPPKRGVT